MTLDLLCLLIALWSEGVIGVREAEVRESERERTKKPPALLSALWSCFAVNKIGHQISRATEIRP